MFNTQILLNLLLDEQDINERKMVTWVRLREIRDASNPFEMPDVKFREYYRLSKSTMHCLINELRPFYKNREYIPFEIKVLAAIYFYAQGCYQKPVGTNTAISMPQSTVSRTLTRITNLINTYLRPYIKFPVSREQKLQNKLQFMEKYHMPGVIACIEGSHIEIVAPPTEDPIYTGHLNINRKGCYTINVLMICDADQKIIYSNTRYPGSVHDSAIWQLSQARRHLIEVYQAGASTGFLLGSTLKSSNAL